ncbi:hypothetical protein [Clostridium guangxiense]|uniref:hypothetical protein n=1 Tax=Clostridium guangxiense TaxID=1662055 RepID=UPI001E2AC917|nr:hypothetical protein [Clostridium guangxiense]MCD2347839.1 hypothetical protein [Clostridium guangxiense]
MFKIIKYEIKTISKEFLIILAAIVLLNLVLMTRINVWKDTTLIMLTFLICFGAGVVAFIYNITMFTRDLKQDTGYLIFSIPKSGYSILGAKMISSIIVIAASLIISAIMSFLLGIVAMGNFNDFIKGFTSLKISGIDAIKAVLVLIADVIIIIIGYIGTLLIIYFSVSVSRAIMNGRKYSGLVSFLIFIIVNLVSGKIYDLLSRAIPKTINPYVTLYSNSIVNSTNNPDPSILFIPINWAGGIFYLVFSVALFIATGYILEKKIDL